MFGAPTVRSTRTLLETALEALRDDDALADLYAGVAMILLRELRMRSGDFDAAEEILEDCLLKFRNRWTPAKCRDDAALLAWFRTTARRLFADRGRDRARRLNRGAEAPSVSLSIDVDSAVPSPLEFLASQEREIENGTIVESVRRSIARSVRRELRAPRHVAAAALLWFADESLWASSLLHRPEALLEGPEGMKAAAVALRLGISTAQVSRVKTRAMRAARAGLDALRCVRETVDPGVEQRITGSTVS